MMRKERERGRDLPPGVGKKQDEIGSKPEAVFGWRQSWIEEERVSLCKEETEEGSWEEEGNGAPTALRRGT